MKYGKTLTNVIALVMITVVMFFLTQIISVDFIDGLVLADVQSGRVGGITLINYIMWFFTAGLLGAFLIATPLVYSSQRVLIPSLKASISSIATTWVIALSFLVFIPSIDMQPALIPAQFVGYISRDPFMYLVIIAITYIVWFVIFAIAEGVEE